jgi:hypothetical protein
MAGVKSAASLEAGPPARWIRAATMENYARRRFGIFAFRFIAYGCFLVLICRQGFA